MRREYWIDLLGFIALFLVVKSPVLPHLYPAFFLDESSDALMQLSYYLHAIRNHGSLYWDHYLRLATQESPQSPLWSPITIGLLVLSLVFHVVSLKGIAILFAIGSYTIHILTGFFFYLFLRQSGSQAVRQSGSQAVRQSGCGRGAAFLGGIGYSYNFFADYFGIRGGYYRASALMIVPLVFLCFRRLFSSREKSLPRLALAALALGICFVSNGDVKPTLVFLFPLILFAFYEGIPVHGMRKTSLLLLGTLFLAGGLTAVQYYPTYEALQQSIRSTWIEVYPAKPLNPYNSLLGFSQTPASVLVGTLFPISFFKAFRVLAGVGVSAFNYPEQRFSFGIAFLALAAFGLFHPTRQHRVWGISFVVFALYLLGHNTPLAPIWGALSAVLHLRYPTRSAIVLYFILSVYVAYGTDILLGKVKSDLPPET